MSKRQWRVRFLQSIIFLLLFGSIIPARAAALPDSIDVNTSALSGISAQLAFDFIDGGPPASDNTITVSNFITDGTLGLVSPTGGVSGTFPGIVTLSDPTFFNEYLTNITLGTSFSFQVDATTNGPSLGSLADAFSLTILDPTTGLPLFGTTDPTGANTLLLLNIDGSANGSLTVYTAPGNQVLVTAAPVSSVPEPSTFLLFGCGVIGLLLMLCRKKSVSIGT